MSPLLHILKLAVAGGGQMHQTNITTTLSRYALYVQSETFEMVLKVCFV